MTSQTEWFKGPPQVEWIKNELNKYNSFYDGSAFLIAVQVKSTVTKSVRWEFDVVEFDCDGEGASLVYRGSREPYDSWAWDDIGYFALLEGKMPSYQSNDVEET
jgi:hypothetical protein